MSAWEVGSGLTEFKAQTLALFPSALGLYDLGDGLKPYEGDILKAAELLFTGSSGANSTGVSTSLRILDSFPGAKQVLMRCVEHYKNETLGYSGVSLRITTSWIAATAPGGFSQMHRHCNSIISGVYYFSGQRNISPIVFEREQQALSLGEPDVYNQFNSNELSIQVNAGRLLLFPSHIRHMVSVNREDSTRYSLAFNLFPVGPFGTNDSSVPVG